MQLQIYSASRSRNFFPMLGTDPVAFSLTTNAYDGIPNGQPLPNGVAQGAGAHAYAWWGFVPNVIGADIASRTVASALHDFGVPAAVSVGHGAHWINVNGVTAIGTIGRNQNYKITGFFVKDPWTGYAATHPAPGQPLGLGVNAWYRYGYDRMADGTFRPGAWFNFFNPVQPG